MRIAARGFSLVELFIVIAIIGVLAALAIPSITEMTGRRAATLEVDTVKAEIELARDAARAHLRCITVTRPSTTSLQFDEMVAATTGCGLTTFGSPTVRQFKATAVDIPNAFTLTFDRTGAVTGGGTEFTDVIVQEKRGGNLNPRTLRVFTLLGLVRKL